MMFSDWVLTPEEKARLNHISKKNLEAFRRKKQARERAAEHGAVIVNFPKPKR